MPQRPHSPSAPQLLATGSPARRAASISAVPAGMRTQRPDGWKRISKSTGRAYATHCAAPRDAPLGGPGRLGYLGHDMPTAGILIIGNEILSGKVADSNSPYFCRELRELGVEVERIVTIPDDVETIASHVRALSAAYDFVFTSGGIGPTHDDMTIEGVAAAFGVQVVKSDSIEGRLRRATRSEPSESLLKMAMIPERATLLDAGDLWFPLVVMENVYIFPGVPELLRKKFESARERFRGIPFVLKRVYVKQRESDIAPHLNELLEEFSELLLGSYPRIGEESFHVMLTLESRDAGYVQRALDTLLKRLPERAVVKVE
jgi:FAD synthetase